MCVCWFTVVRAASSAQTSRVSCARTAELIEMAYGGQIRMNPVIVALHWGPRSSPGIGSFMGVSLGIVATDSFAQYMNYPTAAIEVCSGYWCN